VTPPRFVATCARGLEGIVAAELAALGLATATSEVGGVPFAADALGGVRACWRLRAANRVLLELASFAAPDDETLYREVRALIAAPPVGALAPSALLHPARSFAVAATTSRSALTDTRWIALKTKDAIADAQRARWGRRADVDRDRPDLALRVRLHEDRATLLLDLAGEPLDRRGYRVATTVAPVREQLAAAAILASGWNGVGPVADPMCGSGTFLAEAGAIALGLAPNRLRTRWPFAELDGFRGLLDIVRCEPLAVADPALRLHGNDADPAAIAAARANLAAAGLADRATLDVGDAFAWPPPEGPGLVTVNPPYGERIAQGAAPWRRLGDLLKRRYAGWKAVVLAGDAALGRELGLKPSRRIPFWNGPLEARILVLDLW
jgi:23S rRNA (guanine2445-N2)-methyltransferase / 23S rRNA (guanine2069-N7)-methyltransferase